MAHFAKLDADNKVTWVGVFRDDETEETVTLRKGGVWKKTSYNTLGGVHKLGGTPLRKNYAGIGYAYDAGRDAFIPPQPFPSWTLNEETCLWDPPVPHPGGMVQWDEDLLDWV
jgi:hypothetical protein